MVYHKSISFGSGTPMLLYGYGSYALRSDPSFRSERVSLLDRTRARLSTAAAEWEPRVNEGRFSLRHAFQQGTSSSNKIQCSGTGMSGEALVYRHSTHA